MERQIQKAGVGATWVSTLWRRIHNWGQGRNKNLRAVRGGAKKRVNQLIQRSDISVEIVTGGFVLQHGVLIKENITFSDF